MRELRGTGIRSYQCTTHVELGGRHITLSENLSAAMGSSGGGGPAVTPSDALLYATYRFTFDQVSFTLLDHPDPLGRSALARPSAFGMPLCLPPLSQKLPSPTISP